MDRCVGPSLIVAAVVRGRRPRRGRAGQRGRVHGERPAHRQPAGAPERRARSEDELAAASDGDDHDHRLDRQHHVDERPRGGGHRHHRPGWATGHHHPDHQRVGPGPATTTTTRPPGPAPSTKTYDLVGGTATLRSAPPASPCVAATPKPGFSVDISDDARERRAGGVRERRPPQPRRRLVGRRTAGRGPRGRLRSRGFTCP